MIKEKDILDLAKKIMVKRLKANGTTEIGIDVALIGGYLFHSYIKEARKILKKKT